MRLARVVTMSVVGTFGFALVPACAFDWAFPGGVDPSKDAGGGGDTGAGKDAIAADGGSDGGDRDTSPPLPVGDCSPTQPCAAAAYCSYVDHKCGKGAPTGKCVLRTTTTGCVPAPGGHRVCTCSGNVSTDECTAIIKDGVDINVDEMAVCSGAAPGTFRCGAYYCAAKSDFCLVDAKGGRTCQPAGCTSGATTTCANVPSDCSDIKTKFLDTGCFCTDGLTPGQLVITCK